MEALEAAPFLFQISQKRKKNCCACLLRPPTFVEKSQEYRFVGATVRLCRKYHLQNGAWAKLKFENNVTIGRIHILTFEQINQLSLFHPGEFDLNETFFLSPDLIFTLHPQYCSPVLEIEIERLTNQNGFSEEIIPTAKKLVLCPISVNHQQELDELVLRNFFTTVCDVVRVNEVVGIPIPEGFDNEGSNDPWKILENQNLLDTYCSKRVKYNHVTPPFASNMVYYTVQECTPNFENFSRINLMERITGVDIIEPKRGNHIPHLLELYTSPIWSQSISWTFKPPHSLLKDSIDSKLYEMYSDLFFTPYLLLVGERRSGKRVFISKLARFLQVQLIEINMFDLLGENSSKTCERITTLFKEAASCTPCIIHFRRLNALEKELKLHDLSDASRVSSCFSKMFHSTRSSEIPMGIIGSCRNVYDIPSDIRACFSTELTIPILSTEERIDVVAQNLQTCSLKLEDNIENMIGERTAGFKEGNVREVVTDVLFQSLCSLTADQNDLENYYNGPATQNEDNDIQYLTIKENDIAEALSWSNQRTFTKVAKVPKVYWEDVGGLEEAKQEIIDTIEMPLKFPELFETQRTGVLLFGPPGTGKTLLAKAVATECQLNFISVKGPELLNMYVGESERNVREVFERARNAKPCVLFFDEIDSIAPKRGQGSDGGGVIDRVVSQLLTELDGMDDTKDVFLIAATNRPDLLDPALMRPGRLDQHIYLGIAEDIESKVKIMTALTRKFRLHHEVNLDTLVQILPNGFTGADYYALSSDALMRAYRRRVDDVNAKVEELKLKQPGKHTIQSVLSNMSQNELEVCVEMQDFLDASLELTPSLTPSEIKRYQDLRQNLKN